MSKTFSVKTWSMVLLAGLLSAGAANATTANAETPSPQAQEQAQNRCTGVITDEEGEPLVGATVRVQGTSIAASANIDGEFTLAGVKVGSTIVVNYIGYQPMSVKWDGKPLSIVMKSDGNTLEEVVVLGYGVEQKRAKVTNSIAKVSEKTLTVGSNANPAQALAGAVSGVKVTINSGDPSATPKITIRGGTNWGLGESNDPLVVVDGQIRSSMSDINPNDIASMEILKDAGATALYGARAANGVILISTKTGKDGNGKVNLSVKYGLTHYSSGYDYASAEEYLYYFRRGLYRSSNPNPEVAGTTWLTNFFGMLNNGSQGFSAGNTEFSETMNFNVLTKTADNAYLLQKGWKEMPDPINDFTGKNDILLYRGIDALKENLNENVNSEDYNLSFSGGNDRGNYYASLGYYNAEGALPTTFYKRYNFSFSGGYKISDWLEAKSVFNYTRANWKNTSKGVSNDYVFLRYASMPPTARLTDEEGNPIFGYAGFNMKFDQDKWLDKNQSDKFQMTQKLTATIIPGLTLTGTMSWFYNEQFEEHFIKDHQSSVNGAIYKNRDASAGFLRYFDRTYNLVANFNRTFNEKHTVTAMVGAEFYKRQYKSLSASGNKAATDDFGNLQYTFAGTQDPYQASSRSASTVHANEAILSYMGRVEYDYEGKYLLAATFREDGYSRLQDNRWGFFPGVSAGWVFSQEDFWKKLPVDWINYGKIRSSFGMNGVVNGNIIGYYTLLGAYSSYKYADNTGFRISALPNLGLKWERTRTFEVGLDLGFLQNRFNLGLTYYNRLTMDKYANKSLPATTGFSSVLNNNGKFRNQGVEIDVNATLLRVRDFQWTIGANLTFNKNCVVELPFNDLDNNRQGGIQVYAQKGSNELKWVGGLQEGQEPNHIWGFKKQRILRSWADVEALGDYIDISRTSPASVAIYANESGLEKLRKMGYAQGAVRLSPGDLYWKDRNGDNMIDVYDRYDLGNRMPHWTGGFNTTLSWKGLSLYARFDMGWGFTVYDGSYAWAMGGGQGAFNFMTDIKDCWTPENPNAKLPRWVDASNMGTDSWCRTSDLLATSGAYLACRELSLSYQLPANICKKFRSQGLSLSVTGQNLGYLKKTTLPLPDNTQYTNGASAGWGGTYNLPRNVIFGLNLSF